eukprot:1150342-Pelagomonas_calceolata.AAC.22
MPVYRAAAYTGHCLWDLLACCQVVCIGLFALTVKCPCQRPLLVKGKPNDLALLLSLFNIGTGSAASVDAVFQGNI